MTRKRHPNGAYARFFRGGDIRPAARSPRAVAAAAAARSGRPSLEAGGWRRAPATLVAALVMTSAALPVFSEAAHAQEVSERGAPPVLAEAPVATMRGMVRAGSVPLSDSMLASADGGGILEGVRGFIASILGGDLLPEITFKDATVAGVGGDELGYAYGEEAADLKGGFDEIPQAGPGVELAEVPEPSTGNASGAHDKPGGAAYDAAGAADFTSPSLGGKPGSLDDIASADPSDFGTEELDSPPGGRGELAGLGLPGESPASDLTPKESAPESTPADEPARRPGEDPGTPEGLPELAARDATGDATGDSSGDVPKGSTATPLASQHPDVKAPPPYAASQRDTQGAAPPESDGYGAVPPEEGASPGYAGGSETGGEPAAEVTPYAPAIPEAVSDAGSGGPSYPEPDPDGGTGDHDPGAHDPGGPNLEGGADDGVVSDDPSAIPADGSIGDYGETPVPEDPADYGEGDADPVQPPQYDATPDDDETGGDAVGGTTDGHPEGTTTEPEPDTGEYEDDYPRDEPTAQDPSGAVTEDDGTDASGTDTPKQDPTDTQQVQPPPEQDGEESVSGGQTQDLPTPTDTAPDTTAEPAPDATDESSQNPDEASPDTARYAAPAESPTEASTVAAREPTREQSAANELAAENRDAPRTTPTGAGGTGPATEHPAGAAKEGAEHRVEQSAERRAERWADRKAARQAQRLAERLADRRAQGRASVAGMRAERKADRLARERARRKAAVTAAMDRRSRKEAGRLERRASRASFGAHGGGGDGVGGDFKAARSGPVGRTSTNEPPAHPFAIERPQRSAEPARPSIDPARRTLPAPRFEALGRVAPPVGRPSVAARAAPRAATAGPPTGVPRGGPGSAKTPNVRRPEQALPVAPVE